MAKTPKKAEAAKADEANTGAADTAATENTNNEAEAKADAKKVKFVKMVNGEGKEANVHPDEIHNFASGGYVKKDA